jgi:hypothetical protein
MEGMKCSGVIMVTNRPIAGIVVSGRSDRTCSFLL